MMTNGEKFDEAFDTRYERYLNYRTMVEDVDNGDEGLELIRRNDY